MSSRKALDNGADQPKSKRARVAGSIIWRLDPSESYSDWKIVISSDSDDEAPITYNVHKCMLAAGTFSCEYFTTLFGTEVETLERNEQTSHIKLSKKQAEVFPVFLDLVYSKSGHVNAATTSENAVALLSLARYFQCSDLVKSIITSIIQDLDPENAVDYLEKANEYNDEELKKRMHMFIAENFEYFCKGNSLLRLPFEQIRSIVGSHFIMLSHHESVSILIRDYFREHPNVLNMNAMIDVSRHLRYVSGRAARDILEMIEKMNPECEQDCQALDRLAKLCADSYVESRKWYNIDLDDWVCRWAEMPHNGSKCVAKALTCSFAAAAKKEHADRSSYRPPTGASV